MTSVVAPSTRAGIIYPDSDGLPMAENTLQYRWMMTIVGNLEHLFADDPNVFVAGDLFWYPVEGHPEICVAPDALVAFGRPKGDRLSYMQWEEGNVPPQVVFEVLSPSNRGGEMVRKSEFYRRYGVEEYYVLDADPRRLELSGYLRQGDNLVEVPAMNGHVSPRLGARFDLTDQGLRIFRPDGRPFLTFEEIARRAEQDRRLAEQERKRATQEQQRADQEHQKAEQERQNAERERQRAEQERERAERATAEVEQLRQKLRALGQDPTA
jgi:Uma2 family endonuclease